MIIDPSILAAIDAAAARHGVESALLVAVAHVETGGTYSTRAVSPRGAMGLFQLMPGTAADLGVDPFDPAQAADGAARFLARQYARFHSWPLALAAYNWGPANIRREKNPAAWPPETQKYVKKVSAMWEAAAPRPLSDRKAAESRG